MKIAKMLSIQAVMLILLFAGCKKEEEVTPTTVSNTYGSTKMLAHNQLLSTSIYRPITQAPQSAGNVYLGLAGSFAILSKSGITDVSASAITGDIGSSPITGAAILVPCTEVTGTIYAVDAAGPAPCAVNNSTRLGLAVGDMQTAYNDAAGRLNPNFLNLGAGNIGGLTLAPGLYKWTSSVTVPTNITISGSSRSIWIFQVDGNLNAASGVNITLAGGALARNIYWQVAGAVTLGTTSHFEGTILGKTGINLQTGASINGNLLAQTAVTLQMNTVVKPQ